METVLLCVIVVLGAALVVVFFAMLNVVRGLKSMVSGLESKLTQIQTQVDLQQKNLDALRIVLERRPSDPLAGLFEAIGQYKKRGALSAVAVVALRLFRSYWGKKATQLSLPKIRKDRNST